MFKTLKYNVKTIKRMVAAQKKIELFHMLPFEQEYRGKRIVHDDVYAAANGIYLSAAIQSTKGHKVVVDDEFFSLPLPVQDFILAHEAGHVELGHLDNMSRAYLANRLVSSWRGHVIPEELEADEYAAEEIGYEQTIAALFYLEEKLTGLMGKSNTTKELALRAQTLIASHGHFIEERCTLMNNRLDAVDARLSLL